MMKKQLILAAAALTATACIAGCGSSDNAGAAKENATFIVGMEPTFPPFEFTENDKYVGFDLDLAQALCDKMGVKMEVKSMGFDALIPALKSGQIDMIASGDGYSVVVRKDNTTINGFDDLKGKVVGAQVGTKPVDIATEHGAATVKQYDANSQGWMELNSGTCDAVVINTSVALFYLKQGGDKDLKVVGESEVLNDGLAMAISKEKPEQLEKVNKALADIKLHAGKFRAGHRHVL